MVISDASSARTGESGTIILRVKGSLEFKCQIGTTDVSNTHNIISRTFKALHSQVKSKSLVLNVCNSQVFIWPNKGEQSVPQGVTPTTQWKDVQQLAKMVEDGDGKKKKGRNIIINVVNLNMMTEVTETGPLFAPTLHNSSTKHHFLYTPLLVDCVVCVGSSETMQGGYVKLVAAIIDQLCEMEKVTLKHIKGYTMSVPQPFHFLLPEPAGLVTTVYPAGVPDSQLETERTELHKKYKLPEDRPFLRRANAFHFPDAPYKDGYLRNPHLCLTHPTINNGKLYLVQGVYSYHHYMQDRIDDNGWGCAYRSLQTICSWFLQQGFVEQPVPTHKEIQQALVDVGDKQTSFIGSRQWIGSIEVQAVINQLLGVTSKIMFVSKGSELATKGREFANHFLTEGTPIMIGGGVLAHTILGVVWSETTGQIRYLILDPHYTGAEDLQVITDKGWCGWKGQDFWDQNAYYNLCLPQRPKTI